MSTRSKAQESRKPIPAQNQPKGEPAEPQDEEPQDEQADDEDMKMEFSNDKPNVPNPPNYTTQHQSATSDVS